MIIVLGLVIAVAAIAAGVAGVAANTSDANQLTSDFSVFDYHFAGTTGELFLIGIAVGVAGGLGVGLVSAGTWRSTRRGLSTRRELRQSRKEIAAAQRDLAQTGAPAQRPAAGRPATPAWSMSKLLRKPGKGAASAK
ncbi:hypothetical protein [Nocardia carnea]|uniref:hypothetical protein n=1 Tax=Nocardia carnea TaxID=37328 RepID=UPI002457F94E|nr:hypothetical protein [Nocardia carnea]